MAPRALGNVAGPGLACRVEPSSARPDLERHGRDVRRDSGDLGLIRRTGPPTSRMARRRSEVRGVLARGCLASFPDVWSLKLETFAHSESRV